ncbi:phospholipase D-like domain-containing protein [Cronobacter dublinensis]
MKTLKLDDGMNQCSIYFSDTSEESYTATATHSHWVHYTSGPERQSENFAEYTAGNAVQAFLGGKAYFSALLKNLTQAKKCLYITGWQINWDAQLAPGIRLVDALLEAVKNNAGLQIYIMPWKNPVQVETYATATERVFAAMNTYLGRQVFYIQCAKSQSEIFFSHHQKCVIIDENVAFVGGIDLAYGRYDDHYGLHAEADGRQGMNRYNSCIPPVSHSTGYSPAEEYVVPDSIYSHPERYDEQKQAEKKEAESVQHLIDTVLKHQLWQSQGSAKDSTYLDPEIQPRMPWQDYQVQIEGPAVEDLVRNFVLRWNSYSRHCPKNPFQTFIPDLRLPVTCSDKKGTSQVQVLRSASLNMRLAEYKNMPEAVPQPRLKQDDILRSIHLLISKAEHYIYIENQFFVSDFNKSSVAENVPLSPVAKNINPSISAWATRLLPDDETPQNPVAEWLGDRIKRAILSHMKQAFHLYIMLPVHPEGRLDDPAVVAQIHLTRQSLIFGSHSLLNRIRRSLWVRQQLEAQGIPRKEWWRKAAELEAQCGMAFTHIPLEACNEYVTLLNLRDHAELNGTAVTEQIYVHSKLMIVDDRYVLVGSANINDRSLSGERDSELAVMISDTEHGFTDLDGSGTAVPFRKFARDLRQKAWRKWMGSAAAECAEVLDKPALKTGWEKIQEIAKENARVYEKIFEFIPKNYIYQPVDRNYANVSITSQAESKKIAASVWPVMAINSLTGSAGDAMPFSLNFWQQTRSRYFSAAKELNNVKGYFTALPVYWTEGENNLVPFNMRLIADNIRFSDKNIQLAANNKQKGKEA